MTTPSWSHIDLPDGPHKKDKPLSDAAPSLIWLHGWGQDHHALLPIARHFKKHYPCRLYDQPGFGQTPLMGDEIAGGTFSGDASREKGVTPATKNTASGTADYADALASQLLVDPTIKGPVVIIGHSFGGRVAVQLAARHPSLIAGIILIAGAGLKRRRSPAFYLKAAALRRIGRAAALCDWLFKTQLLTAYRQHFGSADYKAAGILRPTFVKVVSEDLSEQARAVQCPALMLYGNHDNDTPPEIGQKYAALMPKGSYQELEGFSHLDILGHGALQCQAYISDFLTHHVTDAAAGPATYSPEQPK